MKTATRHGFTLIELLVVIAIIGILASILFPVFSQARNRARAVACLNNLSQLGKAMIMYSDDYNGRFPPAIGSVTNGGGWAGFTSSVAGQSPKNGALFSYVRSLEVFKCPSDGWADTLNLSYQMSGPLSAISTGQIDEPSNTIVFLDSNDPVSGTGGRTQDGRFAIPDSVSDLTVIERVDKLTTGSSLDGYNPVHSGGFNATFADGHTSFIREGEATVRNFRPYSFGN